MVTKIIYIKMKGQYQIILISNRIITLLKIINNNSHFFKNGIKKLHIIKEILCFHLECI